MGVDVEYAKNEKPEFSITTLCPPMIYGPPIHSPPSLSELNESNSQLWKIISSGKDAEVPDAHTPLYVDVGISQWLISLLSRIPKPRDSDTPL